MLFKRLFLLGLFVAALSFGLFRQHSGQALMSSPFPSAKVGCKYCYNEECETGTRGKTECTVKVDGSCEEGGTDCAGSLYSTSFFTY